MSELAKREENGRSGETLTQSILLSRFWVLKRSADVDGADFLVQRQSDSLEEVRRRAREIQILGIVQSKYFETSNQVKVNKAYVLDNGQPRKEFFCSLHTHDEEGEHVHYFFSAEDIVDEFELSTCGEYYWFALTRERQYTKYRNPKNRFILDKIERGMNQAEGNANRGFIQNKLKVFARPTMHFQEIPDFQYTLMIVNNVRVVIVKNMKTVSSRLLEPRRDLYENQSDFYWGDDDIGCQFLAVSILAHHFDGDLPKNAPVKALRFLLQELDANSSHVIESDTLRDYIENPGQESNDLQELETKYPMDCQDADIAFFEVVRILGTELSIRCKNGVESIVDTAGCNDYIISTLNAARIFLPGIELNAEPTMKMLAIRLHVERDVRTRKVVKILNSFDLHKLH
ncbi:hypothetical protein [Pectobacterium versatile]|uniref:hypothetical protein n=1 Tax=Pectobacterium versatile TaxID=2488639 RepID=UPI002B245A0A|nr:hypothetical protein [Pectobacterium versatile]